MKRSVLWVVTLALLIASWPAVVGASPPNNDPGWWAEYYANPGLNGKPSITRHESHINYDWGRGAPAPGLPADHFSVRWTRTAHFDTGAYKFCATVDDGVRVWVDGHLIIDQWKVQGATTYCASKQLSAGSHRVQMAYFENMEHAVAKLRWTSEGGSPHPPRPDHPMPQPPEHGGWAGQYFDNKDLSGSPTLKRTDADLRFDWGLGAPAPSLPSDNFSAYWTRDVNFQAGTYNFFAKTDDGVRLWVGGSLVIDNWRDQPATTHSGTRTLSSGTHQVKVAYYEHTQTASIVVWWSRDGAGPPPSPGPGGAVTVDNTDPGFLWGGPTRTRYTVYEGVGGNTYWTHNTSVEPVNYGRWTPRLTAAREYEVVVHIPKRYGSSSRVRYRILHNGQRHDRIVNQNKYSDQWVSLGMYYFNAANTGKEFVLVYDNTREPQESHTIAFDAVKFVPH